MSRTDQWLTSLAVLGLVAGTLAVGLLWLVLMRPVALVEAIGRLQ
jgi:hypothetical protein